MVKYISGSIFPYWGISRVLCNNQGVFGAMNIRLRALLLKIVILSSWDIISHNEVALQHMIWYARYLFKFWYKVLWDNKKWLKYWTDGHFGHWTLKFSCFVLLGHYGCPRGFKLKSFFVEGFWDQSLWNLFTRPNTCLRCAILSLMLRLLCFSSHPCLCPGRTNWPLPKRYHQGSLRNQPRWTLLF